MEITSLDEKITFSEYCDIKVPYDKEKSQLAGKIRCKELNRELSK